MTLTTTELVWDAIDDTIFGVLAFTNRDGEPRTAGLCYVLDGRSLLISSATDTWKVRHIARNPAVSMTVTIPKRIPFLPFLRIPAATITFQGEAEILAVTDVDESVAKRLFRGLDSSGDLAEGHCVIRVIPRGEFVTYGIGMPVTRMRDPSEARGRAPCGTESEELHTTT